MDYFLTFGAGEGFINAARRLSSQAYHTCIFEEIFCYTNSDLKNMSDFWNAHGDFVQKNPRMYGYGVWKPYLVLETLKKMNDGDRLFYADSGCDFDVDCENIKQNYFDIIRKMKEHNVFVNATYCNNDKHMNKKDFVVEMDMLNHAEFPTSQIQATTFLIIKNDLTMHFAEEWYRLCSHYHNIDDSPSQIQNDPDYNEHRHDQSVLSLLLKKLDLNHFKKLGNYNLEYVICLNRNRSGNHYTACRVTGSDYYDINNGNDFIEGNQIMQMSQLIRKKKPTYALETGFASGRTAATLVLSTKQQPLKKYVNCECNYNYSGYYGFFAAMLNYFRSFETSSQRLFRSSFFTEHFPQGIDWFTVDGDGSYQGVLFDLVPAFPYMNNGGIIYIVGDRKTRIETKQATDFFETLFPSYLKKTVVAIKNTEKEMAYFEVVKL